MSEFTCCKCNRTYPKRNDEEWNDFKANEELINLYPECKNDSVDLLCGECNELFKTWFSSLTEKEKIKIREEYKLDKCKR